MRRPPYHRDPHGRLDVKMTPMIDVIFLLLIFFVCTASFQPVEEVLPTNLSLPGTVDSPVEIEDVLKDLDEIIVKILWTGDRPGWRINQREYGELDDVGSVLEAMAEVKLDLPVILDVDGDVPLENVIDVYDLCRRIGLQRIQFAVSSDV